MYTAMLQITATKMVKSGFNNNYFIRHLTSIGVVRVVKSELTTAAKIKKKLVFA